VRLEEKKFEKISGCLTGEIAFVWSNPGIVKLIGGDANLVRTKTPSKPLMFRSFSLDL